MIVEELVDIATRHQVYLERLKAGEIRRSDSLFGRLDRDLQTVLLKLRLTDLALLPALEAAALVEDIRKGQTEAYTEHLQKLILMLRELADMERDFELQALDEVTIDEVEPDDGDFAAALWPFVTGKAMSANGKLLAAYLALWAATEVTRGEDLVRKAISEGWSVTKLRTAFRGTPAARYSDGLFGSSKRNTATTINTAVQHVSAAARVGVMTNTTLRPKSAGGVKTDAEGRVTSITARARKAAAAAGIKVGDKISLLGYRWVSILDSLTSQICRSLDMQVFQFGSGPIPPAHPNCRSVIVAEMLGKWMKRGPTGRFVKKDERKAKGAKGAMAVDGKVSYYEWLKTQPPEFQDDALGVTRATLFRKGGLSAAAFAKLNLGRRFQPLTLEEMRKLAPRAFKRAGI